MFFAKRLASVLMLAVLAACSSSPKLPSPVAQVSAPENTALDITLFSFNDLHGNLQSDHPTPYMVKDEHDQDGHAMIPTGGYAYLSTVLKQRRAAVGPNLVVGAGDMIGASPLNASLLKDEPVIEALNRLDLSVTSLGNHEFDGGREELLRKMHGGCPQDGCRLPGFHGASYDYLAANVIETATGKPWIKPYVIRQVGPVKIAFIGAVTKDTPNIVVKGRTDGLKFEDEADAVNRFIPEIKQAGVNSIVLLIHEGGSGVEAANDPSYECKGLKGPIIDITKRLDPAVDVVISAHSHQAYTCKIDGRLVVQARSYGSLLTEVHMKFDASRQHVIATSAFNHTIDQTHVIPDPEAKAWVDNINQMTSSVRERKIANLSHPLLRKTLKEAGDSVLGRVLADAALAYAQRTGAADIAFMNSGGVRSDLPSTSNTGSVDVTYADLVAVQPFGNYLVRMTMSGQQIIQLLQQQWGDSGADGGSIMAVSQGLSYQWRSKGTPETRLLNVRLNGQPIDPKRKYIVIANNFLAEGGGGMSVFAQGSDRSNLGLDVDAMDWYLHEHADRVNAGVPQRMIHID